MYLVLYPNSTALSIPFCTLPFFYINFSMTALIIIIFNNYLLYVAYVIMYLTNSLLMQILHVRPHHYYPVDFMSLNTISYSISPISNLLNRFPISHCRGGFLDIKQRTSMRYIASFYFFI